MRSIYAQFNLSVLGLFIINDKNSESISLALTDSKDK